MRPSLINSQFHEPPNDVVDGELRVLLATDPGGRPEAPSVRSSTTRRTPP
jgi:hypothetical protein